MLVHEDDVPATCGSMVIMLLRRMNHHLDQLLSRLEYRWNQIRVTPQPRIQAAFAAYRRFVLNHAALQDAVQLLEDDQRATRALSEWSDLLANPNEWEPWLQTSDEDEAALGWQMIKGLADGEAKFGDTLALYVETKLVRFDSVFVHGDLDPL